ncbi:hypothetical protein FACS189452_10000 [Bacteroidia bacterium]|nr:hypothetical protein FACS189452_10000 [Bacteroidia bacterium]GHT82846.1 hypothetical protein FACS189467_8290 [Bacteroidia bacterium]
MKHTILPLLVGFLVTTVLSSLPVCANAQNYGSIRPTTYDISYDLDLRAVVDLFADSRSIEDFELRLNDNKYDISNLDLNRDGRIDYLRVVEMYESNVHLIAIQAVLAQNIFQDVATITLERNRIQSQSHIQIIGDPYIYGANYIIEPVFYRTPVIFDWFWRPTRYVVWRSPYYWNYYPRIYIHRPILQTHIYMTHVHDKYYNPHNRYNYTNVCRSQPILSRVQPKLSRNDYARSHPNNAFDRRNVGVQNTREIRTRDVSAPRRTTTQQNRQTPAGQTPERNTPSNRTPPATSTPATQSRPQPAGNTGNASTTRSNSSRDANSTRSGSSSGSQTRSTSTRPQR